MLPVQVVDNTPAFRERQTIQLVTEVFKRRYFLLLSGISLATFGCAPGRLPATAVPSRDNGYISLGPRAKIRATLTSTEAATAFKVSGVGAGADLLLPRSNIVRVLLPPAGITITAQAPCFEEAVHFVQAGSLSDGSEIAFTFSNIDRFAGCNENTGSSQAREVMEGPRMGSTKLAWVIANSRYANDWAQLPFVETDRDRMSMTLQRSGYHVMDSFNRSLVQILEDAIAFKEELVGRWPR